MLDLTINADMDKVTMAVIVATEESGEFKFWGTDDGRFHAIVEVASADVLESMAQQIAKAVSSLTADGCMGPMPMPPVPATESTETEFKEV